MDVLISDRLAMAGHSYRASSFLWMAFLNVCNKDLAYASKIAKRWGGGGVGGLTGFGKTPSPLHPQPPELWEIKACINFFTFRTDVFTAFSSSSSEGL